MNASPVVSQKNPFTKPLSTTLTFVNVVTLVQNHKRFTCVCTLILFELRLQDINLTGEFAAINAPA